MNLKKLSLSLILFTLFGLNLIYVKKVFAIIPFYNLPNTDNLQKESLSIGKSAYQLLYYGQIKEALNLAKLAISLNEEDEQLWAILADVQIANNLKKNALESLKIAKEINPFMSELYFAESSIYLSEKNYNEAKKVLKEGLEIAPDNHVGIFQLGNIYLIEKKLEKAINSFNKAILIKKDFWQAINNKGLAYFELDKIELSIKYFEEAINLEKNAEPLLGLATSILNKDKKKAIELAKEALLQDPKYVSQSYRKEQLWGIKIQKATKQLLNLKELEETIIITKQYLK
ncbi:MAG: pilus assembly protein TadD [Prochlorococcus sp. SP3034]|nr:pilus assembly protein TadD [Prochlorococcus sp. SP3034]|tara:strand:+ start:22929 stop:23789 length:861 start_codon:yes stop_codon:yes gene_type:complete